MTVRYAVMLRDVGCAKKGETVMLDPVRPGFWQKLAEPNLVGDWSDYVLLGRDIRILSPLEMLAMQA